jgi:hypothetical protein
MKNNSLIVVLFGALAFFFVGFGTISAAKRNDVSGNFVFSSFSTTTKSYNVSTTTSTTLLATTTVKNRQYAEIVNTSSQTMYCNVNGNAAAATTSLPVYASSSFKFATVDAPYQGSVRCIASGNATGTAFVFETGI